MYERNRNWPRFLQLALICAARGWDPEDYVHRAFGNPKRSSEVLTPSDLVSKPVVDAYAPNTVRAAYGDEYRQCIELLIGNEADGIDEKSLLMSPMTPFPAWFRVFYPEEIDMDIVGAWSDTAKHEIAQSSALIEFLKETDPVKWERVRKVLWFFDEPRKEGSNDR